MRAAVLDLPLPERYGVETLDTLSEVAHRVPRLIPSGADTEEQVQQVIEREARDYLMNYPAGVCRFWQRCTQ